MKRLQTRLFPKAICALAVCAAGCSHTVEYKLTEKDKWQGPKRPQVVRVETFQESGAVPEFDQDLVGQKRCRTNARKRYKKEPAVAVSEMVAKHLKHSGLFTKVVREESGSADVVLSGVISNYVARGIVNETAEAIQVGAGAATGLIGAIIGSALTSGMKTEIDAKVELNPVTLRDQSGKVLWHGSVAASTNFTAHFSRANESAVYEYPDTLLKQAVNDLIRKLAQGSE